MPQVAGVDHWFIPVGELSFHVALAGEGVEGIVDAEIEDVRDWLVEGPREPILLLHGWPQHWYAWREVIPRLAERRRVMAMDLRGFGWTDIAWEGFDKEGMADDVAGVLAQLGIDRVAVIGHDWGGWIGFLLAIRRPELVERLIVLSSPPPWAAGLGSMAGMRRLRRQLLIASPLGPLLLRRSIGFASRQILRLAVERVHLDRDELSIYDRDLRASTRARAGALLHRTFVRRELPELRRGRYRDHRLATPTLVLYGDRDLLLDPGAFADHGDHADHLRTEAVTGAGHYLPEEAPSVVAERALDFLADDRDPVPAAGAGVPG
jgi:pimeloyl-ACP methyl ester carboxylesterase